MDRRVLSFNYTLRDTQGQTLDASDNSPLAFLEGAKQIIPALEAQIINLKVGDKRNVKLLAADAYGLPDPKMVMDVPKEELAHLKIEVGGFLELQLQESVKVVRVDKISETTITLDGNHPLAGQDLEFEVEIIAVRNATKEELSHGHAHHGDGHHH